MVWSITDQVIEDRATRQAQFEDLRAAGFEGVAAFVRCSRYSWDDPPAGLALKEISDLCQKAGMLCWVGPDPRFVSHHLAGDASGLEVLLYGNASRADAWPNLVSIDEGRFNVRCALPARHVHTLRDVAVEFHPLGLARVYALRRKEGPLGKTDVIDLTGEARMFYNARDRYVEAFGHARLPGAGEWVALAFFHVRTNHVDFSSPRHMRDYAGMLGALKRAGCAADGIMWDEPGYTCTYGSLPFSPVIRRGYRASAGHPLERDLWKIAMDAEDGSHAAARVHYYATVQKTIVGAERKLKSTAHRLWGRETALGIHDTWHFESADMADMTHGSMNLWETVPCKTGGFVDIGAIQRIGDPSSSWYAQHAAMLVVGAALGRLSSGGYAYHNLWTEDDDGGAGGQYAAMDQSVKSMALFGIRWLAHAYGSVGTIGQERTFLGSRPLPGYPDHSTWKHFPAWNAFSRNAIAEMEGRLPATNLLVVYPVDSLYVRGGTRADEAALRIFNLLLRLLDEHYHPDVLSPSVVARGKVRGGRFHVQGRVYDGVLFPYPAVMSGALSRLLSRGTESLLFAYETPVHLKPARVAAGEEEIFAWLARKPELRPVNAPEKAWTTMTVTQEGMVVSVAPARATWRYEGDVTFNGKPVHLEPSDRLTRILFPLAGEPRVFSPAGGK
jgi:hypothetical protein